MKNWTQRFAVFAILGAIVSSAMLVGCGSPDEETTTTNNAGTTTTTTNNDD